MEMECVSRAVLFCTEEPRKRQMPVGVGKTGRISHWSFKGSCVIRGKSLAALIILKYILVPS